MNKGNKVKITICGKEYSLQADEQPAYVQQLAARLDQKITELMEENDTLSLSSAAILVGLSLMDDSYKTTSDMDNIRGEIRNYVEEAGKARAEADNLRIALEDREREIESLKTELGLKELRRNIAPDGKR
ncbi:MAG: cell division protein ZapA [Oscillospiraceae bacterium]|nr:cell division protein ZapA [Oscillospiraceae bacterium]